MFRKLGVLTLSLCLVLVLVPSVALAEVPAILGTSHGIGGDHEVGSDSTPGTPPPGGKTRGRYTLPKDQVVQNWPVSEFPVPQPLQGQLKICVVQKDGRKTTGYTIVWKKISKAEGARLAATGRYVSHIPASHDMIIVWYSCNYPPRPVVKDVKCAKSLTMKAVGPMSAPKTLWQGTIASDWSKTATTRTNPSLCVSSLKQYKKVPLRELGRFRMDGVASVVPCKKITYPGTSLPSKIFNCGGPVLIPRLWKAQVWCDGFSKNWTTGNPHAFTMEECRDREKPEWKCAPSSVQLDGHASPVAVLDDGKVRKAKWTNFRLIGHVKDDTGHQTQLSVAEGSSPSRGKTVPQGDETQKYKVPTGWIAGKNADANIQWYAPGVPGSSWRLNRIVSFTAQFRGLRVSVESMNMLSDEMELKVEKDIWLSRGATCNFAPLVVTVNRARNST